MTNTYKPSLITA